jgi:site-specific recombinase XerD
MIRINFYQLLSKGKLKNEGPIYMRVKGLDKRLNISTGICQPSSDWDKKKERFKLKHPNAYNLNCTIQQMEDKIWSYIEEKTKKKEQITSDVIKNFLKGKEKPKDTLLTAFDYFISNHCQSLNKGTKKHYISSKNKIITFLCSKYDKNDMELEYLNFAFISKFKVHLEQHYKNNPNTINKDITRLKAVLNYAIKLEWLSTNPFNSYRSTTVPTVKSVLNLDDINKIERYTPKSETYNIVKDGFLFMCYTGLSYSDLQQLKKDNIQTTINGNKIIKISRKKTSEYCMIPLVSKALSIIEKYSNNPFVVNNGCALPVISNQKMNDYIKEIVEELGITKTVSCHVARHSFATNALELGVPIETVSKALGHSSIKTTQIYAKITESKLCSDFRIAETKVE